MSSASRLLPLAFAIFLLLGVLAPRAGAAGPGQYGQVQRFGGFDLGAENQTTPEAGKFLNPRGFAVDTQDSTGGPNDTAIYVLDRTSTQDNGACCESTTSWRVQKLTEKGAVLGTATFTLPNKPLTATAVDGLAVDHAAGRLYALVVGQPPKGAMHDPVARELIAFSITPNVSKELVAPIGLTPDPLGTKAGLVSSQAQLQAGGLFYLPQGIAVVGEGTGTPAVAIEATNLQAASAGSPIGAAIVQRVSSETGVLVPGTWSSESVASVLGNESWGPAGISRNPDGSLTVLLNDTFAGKPLYTVHLSADLTTATVLDPEESLPAYSLNFDELPFSGGNAPLDGAEIEQSISDAHGAGPELVQLSTPSSSTTGGLYAALFVGQLGIDPQFGSEQFSFHPGEREVELGATLHYQANLGVRLLQANGHGQISDPQGGTIVNTLGNPALEGTCDFDSSQTLALAAGNKGALWVLVDGPGSQRLQEATAGNGINPTNTATGDQVIELAPGAGTECPQPAGTFTMQAAGGSPQPGNSEITIPAGTTVKFDARSLERQGGIPFAYKWQLNSEDPNPHLGMPENEIVGPTFAVPPATAEYAYTQKGTYKVKLTFRSDYGTYTTPEGTVKVTGSLAPPVAKFKEITPSPQPGTQVTFESESQAGSGTISAYKWSWGDGAEETISVGPTTFTHTYASPGTYQAQLVVTNSFGLSSPAYIGSVVVAGAVNKEPPKEAPKETPKEAAKETPKEAAKETPSDRSVTSLSAHASELKTNGMVMLTLSCPATKAFCAGTVTIESANAITAKKHAKRKRVVLGQASFDLSGGKSENLSLRLSSTGLKLLGELKHIPAVLIVSAHDSFGDPGTQKVSLTLTPPASSKHRKKHH